MLKVKASFFILLFIIISSSCSRSGKKNAYSKSATGLQYKLQAFGEGNTLPKEGDFLQLQMVYRTEKDSIFLDTRYENPVGKIMVPYAKPSFIGSFEEGIAQMHEGDSMSFLVSADSVFKKIFKSQLPRFIRPGSLLKVDILLNKIMDEKAFEEELTFYSESYDDWDMKEQTALLKFMKKNFPEIQKDSSGIYYISIQDGTGDRAWWDTRILVHYKASFLDGKVIDSTYDDEPFEFVMGQEGQVLKGFEIGLRKMRQGGKAKFILPSYLAFGAKGSNYFIVPPYTSIIYDVELIKVETDQIQ